MKQQLSAYLLPDRPIAFNRDFVRLGCGVKGALMLSQAIYWCKRTENEDGSFWKTQEEWQEETGMKRHEQMNAIQTLKKLDFITVEKRGLPAKNHYIVNVEKIIEKLSLLDDQSSGKRTTGGRKSGRQVKRKADDIPNTESTTEITTIDSEPINENSPIEKQIGEVIYLFRNLNPVYKTWYNRNPVREKCRELLDTFGFVKVKNAIKFSEAILSRKFAPTITTPAELFTSWGKLQAYYLKESSSQQKNKGKNYDE